MADEARKQLLADVKRIRATSDFSDLTIICGDDKYSVHKNIICCRSAVFAKAIRFPGKEAEENMIDLSDNEPAIVKLLVQYVYDAEFDPTLPSPKTDPVNGIPTQTVPHTCSVNVNNLSCRYNNSYYPHYNQICPHHRCGTQCNYDCASFSCDICFGTLQGDAEHLLIYAKMYEMADKYDVAGLKDLCIEKYRCACLEFWDHAKFAESAYHVYCTTPSRDKGLRNVVCKTLSDHMNLLKKPEIEDLMTQFNGLASGLLLDKAKQYGWCNK